MTDKKKFEEESRHLLKKDFIDFCIDNGYELESASAKIEAGYSIEDDLDDDVVYEHVLEYYNDGDRINTTIDCVYFIYDGTVYIYDDVCPSRLIELSKTYNI